MSHVHLQMTDELIGYLRASSPEESDVLKRLRKETESHPRGRMQITPEQGNFFALLIRLMNAKKTLEIGVFTGYSSISVAQALPQDGKLIACDLSEEFTAVARRYWKQAGLESKIDLRLGPALESLEKLKEEGHSGTFDFAFIDADKTNYRNYYEQSLTLLRPGGLIALDNVLWGGEVLNQNTEDPDTIALQQINEWICRDERVSSCMLPVGDGLTLALKK